MALFPSRSLTLRKSNYLVFDENLHGSAERGHEMTYSCEDCGFLFCRVGAAKECPSCEKNNIRSATEEKIGWLQKLLEKGKPTLRIKEGQTL